VLNRAVGREGKGSEHIEVIERLAEHYEAEDVEYGRVYKWCPECVVVRCACGKRATHKRADVIGLVAPACECGKDEMPSITQELVPQLLDEEYETLHHPWRYWHPPKEAGILF
jgi:hypothetical protein